MNGRSDEWKVANLKVEAPAASQSPPVQIEDFRGDSAQVARLVQESWQENGNQGLFYTPEFLASYLSYPGSSYALAPALYQDENPCAFVAGFPRTIQYKGRELRVMLCTLLSVSSEYKKRGYGVVLWSELVKRAQSAGYDGMVNYCVEGEPMNGMILGCCRMLKLPTERIFSVHYLMRLLQPKSVISYADDSQDLTEEFRRAAGFIGDDTPLRRVKSPTLVAGVALGSEQKKCVRSAASACGSIRESCRSSALPRRSSSPCHRSRRIAPA